MGRTIYRLSSRRPRLVALALVLAAVAGGALMFLAPGELETKRVQATTSDATEAREALERELGYDPVPGASLLVSGEQSLRNPASRLAIDTVVEAARGVEGVAAVVPGPRSGDRRAQLLRVHFRAGIGSDEAAAAALRLGRDIDPGLLSLEVTGPAVERDALRDDLADEAPATVLLALPLSLLVLVGIAGFRLGLIALLAGVLGAGLASGALLLIEAFGAVDATAQVAAAFAGLVLATETALALSLRYREEAAVIGPGPEAVEYSLATVSRGIVAGGLAVALTGLALVLVPVDPLPSIGAGLLAAALLAPAAAALLTSAVLVAGFGRPPGDAMPMVPEDGQPEGGSRSFRALTSVLGRRGPALVAAALAIAAGVVLALPGGDPRAAGGSSGELLAGPERDAADAVTMRIGPSATGPLLVSIDGPPEVPSATIYRDEVSRIEGVTGLGRPQTVGEGALFEALIDVRPRSLAAQEVVASIEAIEQPGRRVDLLGAPAAFDRAAEEAGGAMPIAFAVLLALLAAGAGLMFRSGVSVAVVLLSALPALAAFGAMQLVFAEARFEDFLGYDSIGAPHLVTQLLVAGVVLAVSGFRAGGFGAALAEERALGAGVRGATARVGVLTIGPALGAGLVGAAVAAAWIGTDLLVAKEAGLGLAVGLLVDSLLVRIAAAPAAIRLLAR